ncbi:MAG: carbohydrate kinase [Firmicutes bacterium]|nr:carbohydrate kinase [Bacillota bacterium]
MVQVLCLGHAAYDLSVPVSSFPAENSKMEIESFHEAGGGPAANAAYLLSSWGVNCAFAGLIGNDSFGQRILEEFKTVGTDLSLLEIRAGHPTPLSVILVNTTNGSRTIINRKAKTRGLQINQALLARLDPKILFFDGHEPEASLLALESYPKAITVLDAGSLRPGTRLLAEKVDYLIASERFALQMTGLADLDTEEQWKKCLAQLTAVNPRQVIVTQGEKGLIYTLEAAGGKDYRRLPAFPVTAVDTTGAGDIFHGAFTYGLLQKLPLHENLRFASMAAALSVTKPGGRPSIPTLSEVNKELATYF